MTKPSARMYLVSERYLCEDRWYVEAMSAKEAMAIADREYNPGDADETDVIRHYSRQARRWPPASKS